MLIQSSFASNQMLSRNRFKSNIETIIIHVINLIGELQNLSLFCVPVNINFITDQFRVELMDLMNKMIDLENLCFQFHVKILAEVHLKTF